MQSCTCTEGWKLHNIQVVPCPTNICWHYFHIIHYHYTFAQLFWGELEKSPCLLVMTSRLSHRTHKNFKSCNVCFIIFTYSSVNRSEYFELVVVEWTVYTWQESIWPMYLTHIDFLSRKQHFYLSCTEWYWWYTHCTYMVPLVPGACHRPQWWNSRRTWWLWRRDPGIYTPLLDLRLGQYPQTDSRCTPHSCQTLVQCHWG